MKHLSNDMTIDIKVVNWKSHFNGPLKMIGEGACIFPFFEELIVKMNSFFELSKVCSPPHLSKKLSFMEFEGFVFLKIGATLNRPDSKTQFRKSATISIGDLEMNFSWHSGSLFSGLTVNPMGLDFKSPIPILKRL